VLWLATLALILVAAAVLAVWRRGRWIALFLGCGVLTFLVATLSLGFAGELLLVTQFIVLLPTVAVLVFFPRGLRKWLGAVVPLVVTIALYAMWHQHAEESYQDYLHLLELYPYESVEGRVRIPNIGLGPHAESDAAVIGLGDLEYYTDQANSWDGNERTYHLRLLHESTVDSFLKSPAFGVRRRPTAPEAVFLAGVRNNKPIPQPVARSTPPDPSGLAAPWPTVTKDENLRTLHFRSVADFSYPSGRGYAKDRSHVAGFRPHEFSQLPATDERWAVETVDLVSLLCHTEPVAYVSADLPRMEELRGASTRALDAFEASALTKLTAGDLLVVGEGNEQMRLLGAIRAVRQCVACHGCERGDLLGAFSYTLRRTAP
jgi:hypothetical protein